THACRLARRDAEPHFHRVDAVEVAGGLRPLDVEDGEGRRGAADQAAVAHGEPGDAGAGFPPARGRALAGAVRRRRAVEAPLTARWWWRLHAALHAVLAVEVDEADGRGPRSRLRRPCAGRGDDRREHD